MSQNYYYDSSNVFHDDSYSLTKTVISGVILGGAAATAALYFYLSSPGQCSSKSLPGLVNLGNTCYVNSLLQALASCPSIVGWLKRLDIEKSGLSNGFVDALRTTILGLDGCGSSVSSAAAVVKSLAAHGWDIAIGEEHDLYELFNVFVTTWEDELKGSRLSGSLEDCKFLATAPPMLTRRQLAFERSAAAARLDARLRAPCIGLTATQYRCCNPTCRYATVKYESFSALTLSIPNSQMGAETSIESLLRRFFCSEVIRDATCERCKKSSRKQMGFLKKHGIVKLPQTLLVRVERVGMLPSGHLKLNEHVAFNECLSVQELCYRKDPAMNEAAYEESRKKWQCPAGTSRVVGGAEDDFSSTRLLKFKPGCSMQPVASIDGGSFVADRRDLQKYAYQLRAICEHRGGPLSGHFVTYRRGPSPHHFNWFLTNDSNVSQVTYTQMKNCQAYMLFYERIKPSRWYSRSSGN